MAMLRSGKNLALTGVVGVAVAAYGVYVEHQKRQHPSKYSALCDSKYFSCSKVRLAVGERRGHVVVAYVCCSYVARILLKICR